MAAAGGGGLLLSVKHCDPSMPTYDDKVVHAPRRLVVAAAHLV